MNWQQVPESLYTNLGRTGLKISKVIFGCMSFGDKNWGSWLLENEDEVFAVLKKAYDAGIRTFDTADMYSNGSSEILLGKFIKKYNIKRSKIVILTKCFFAVDEEHPDFHVPNYSNFPGHEYVNQKGLSRKHVLDAAEDSVRRLGTYIDVYQIHRFDSETPIEETMEALHDVVKSGKARYIGASKLRAYQLVMMQNVAEKHGWTKFVSMQSYYSLLYREDELEMIAYSKLTGVGLIPFSPNAGGVLTRPLGQFSGTTARSGNSAFAKNLGLENLSEGDKTVISRVEELSVKHGVSMATIATAWVIAKEQWPIVGFSSPDRIDDAIKAIQLTLTDQETEYLEETYTRKSLPWMYS